MRRVDVRFSTVRVKARTLYRYEVFRTHPLGSNKQEDQERKTPASTQINISGLPPLPGIPGMGLVNHIIQFVAILFAIITPKCF